MDFNDAVHDGDGLALQSKDRDISSCNRVFRHVQKQNITTGKGRIHALSTWKSRYKYDHKLVREDHCGWTRIIGKYGEGFIEHECRHEEGAEIQDLKD